MTANISTAQACMADLTTPQTRAKGMGLIGAAFGIGFIFGPVLGGLSLKHLGELAPGLLAGGICGLNLLLAWARLPESLDPAIQAANRAQPHRRYDPLNLGQIGAALSHRYLGLLMVMGFLQVTAFGSMEQVFSLFFKVHLNLSLADAGAKTGYALAFVGVVSAVIQGGLIRRLTPRYGERRLLVSGLLLFTASIFFMPFGPTYGSYFLILLPLAVGRSFIDPSTSSLISKAVSANEQGRTFGTFQGLNSLARVIGPFVGLTIFDTHPALPFLLAGGLCVIVLGLSFVLFRQTHGVAGVDSLQ
jgi:MFS family permease